MTELSGHEGVGDRPLICRGVSHTDRLLKAATHGRGYADAKVSCWDLVFVDAGSIDRVE